MKALRRARVRCLEWTLSALGRLARWRGTADGRSGHLRRGQEGEDAAYFFLCRQGFEVVARRWSSGDLPGDVDLIAWQGPTLCFVEVKTRTVRDTNPAEITVHQHKRTTLRRLARQYVRQLAAEPTPPVRFDVVSVYLAPGKKPEAVHFERAFGWSDFERQWE